MARILLVEDYPDLLELMNKMLVREHGSVETFMNGREAQERLKTEAFDLIILDWDLPEVSGLEICKGFRTAGGTTPILMLTGKKMIAEKEAAFDAGADDYLTKPFHPKELSARVKALLRRSQASQQATLSLGSDLVVGATLADRYEIIALVGHGSMGVVYKANHKFLNKSLAVKVLQPQLVVDKEKLARFQQEAKAVSSLDHPNIISLYDYGISKGGLPFLVMDYLEGESLAAILRREDHLEVDRALALFIQACDALAHSHTRGVVHRDLKPSNLVLIKEAVGGEKLKVVDFGIAKLIDDVEAQNLTHTGEAIGSPLYMSPEQCTGQDVDARSDIFSLGCVMYESLTGSPPFVGTNMMDTLVKRLYESAKPLHEVRPSLKFPELLELVMTRVLAREANSRYQSMEELKAELVNVGLSESALG